MDSATNVHRRSSPGKVCSGSLPVQRAMVQVVWGDVLGAFTAAALQARPERLLLVSPWISETDHGRLRRLVDHADRHGAAVFVLTRPSSSAASARALDIVRRARRHTFRTNDQLHAKLYVCEEADQRGVALVGSANLTLGGTLLAEVGVLVRPLASSRVIDDLAKAAVTYLGGRLATPARRTA